MQRDSLKRATHYDILLSCTRSKAPAMDEPAKHISTTTNTGPLRELAVFFLRLGTTAFGRPAAHIAIIEHQLVRRRQLPTRAKLLALLLGCHLNSPTSSSRL